MPEKYQNKYRIRSARLQNWDYGWNGAYFVTICTKNREYYFGEIANEKMILSEIGENADDCWLQIPKHFPFVKLDVHVVMPNHIHGIIVIDKTGSTVETQNSASLQSNQSQPKNKFGPQSKNSASIIRGFKIGVTKNARNKNIDFAWQSRYHDHIIPNKEEYDRIKNYIINNPKNWGNDKFFNPE